MSVEESDVIKRSLELQKRKDDFIRKCQMERVQQEEAELEMAQKARKRFYHECPFEKEAEKPIWDENGSLIQYIEKKSNKYVPRSEEEEEAPEPPKKDAKQKTPKQRKQRRRIKKRVRKVKQVPEGNEHEEAQKEENEENKNDEHEEAQKEEHEHEEEKNENEEAQKNENENAEKNENEEENKKEEGEKSSEYEYEYEEEEEEEEETEEELERKKRIDARKDFMKRNATFDKTEKKVRISKRIHHVSKEFLKRQRKAAQRRNTPKVEEQATFSYRSPRSKALSKNKTYKSRDRQVEEQYSFRPDIGASKNYPTRGLPVQEAEAHIFLKDLDRQGRSLEMQVEVERECTFHPVFEGSPAYRERLAKRSEQRQKAKLEALQKEKEQEAARSKQ